MSTQNITADKLIESIDNRTAKIAVVGVGYVGLPLAVHFAEAGFTVTGYDVKSDTIEKLNRGESHISDISSERLSPLVKLGKFHVTSDESVLGDSDIIFICVPTPFTRNKTPDISYIEKASDAIEQHLKSGQLIILESTTYPGTTLEVVKPRLDKKGLVEGEDYFLVFSPERVDPGNTVFTIANTPKVVGGLSPVSTDICCRLYSIIVGEDKVVPVSCPTVAEMVKLLENTFRAVNIALVFEMAFLCHRMGIDLWEVIEAAKTKPFGFMPFYPSPGVGGHCIPVDPYYLYWKGREYDFHTRFIELAAETNLRMPDWVLQRITRLLNRAGIPMSGAKILALGATFKPDCDDARNSPALRVIELLLHHDADVFYHDPYVKHVEIGKPKADYVPVLDHSVELNSIELTDENIKNADLIVALVNHSDYDWNRILSHSKRFFDTRGVSRNYPQFKDKVTLL
ncbi:MAG TPA: nucleotide sugar dehydrogenase [Firmicutes bacterium]|nr:nucleotide sugar dehydrogenase [Bacillota bacterium]